MTEIPSAGARFRAAVAAEKPLQVIGAINAYHAKLAEHTGYKALYISGGGVAAGSLGLPDLGITTLDDVLTDVRRITDATDLPVLVDIDTGFGGAFNIARTVKSMIKFGAGAVHIEDQVRPSAAATVPARRSSPRQEMVDRIKAAVDARTDPVSSSWPAPMRWRWKAWSPPSTAPAPASRRARTWSSRKRSPSLPCTTNSPQR